MPIYKLYTRPTGVTTWTYSGYTLQIAGNSNGVVNVGSRLDPPGTGAWTAVSGATRSGNGNPNAPANGDDLGLPSTIGTVTNVTGDGTYSSIGDGTHGAGYYTTQGAAGDEGDWCATAT